MKKAKTLYFVIIAVCLSAISAGVYFILGGFDPVEIYFFNGTTRTVIGREYILADDNKYFQQQMDSAKADLLRGNLTGMLTAVVYQDEDLKDSIRYFIGASQDSIEGVVRVPAGFDYRQYRTERIYKIFVTQSGWVSPTPEEIEEELKAWQDWMGGIGAQGKLQNPGEALGFEGRTMHSDGSVTDGPYAELKEIVGGFMIVSAESIEEATELAKGCPALTNGGKVEVRDIIVFEDM